MTVNLLKQSRTVIIPQPRSKATGANRRVLHNDYVYFCDIPLDTPQDALDRIVEALEDVVGADIWNISVVFDYTAQAPDGSEGASTIKLSCMSILDDTYRITA